MLKRCIGQHETEMIMGDAHEVTMGGHYAGKETTHKIMHARLWWPTIFQDTKDYCDGCDVC